MTSRHLALALALAAAFAGRVAVAAEATQPARYGTLASLKALECLESWEQVCAYPLDILEFAVFEDRVEVTPYMDDTAFVFRVKAHSGGLLELRLASCRVVPGCMGKGQAARLTLKGDGFAVYDGPDVYGLLDGRVERIRLEIVSNEIYKRTSDELERKYVPGGKCGALMAYEWSGRGPCLNAPGHLTPAGDGEREYRFVHLETTGLTSGILVPGPVREPGHPERAVFIAFSKDSDPDAVQSLKSLDETVLLPNGSATRERDGIVLVGALKPDVLHTPAGTGMAASEPYQEFRLSRWYLRAPFVRVLAVQTPDDDAPPRVQDDDRLRPEDFDHEVGGDLARFVRRR